VPHSRGIRYQVSGIRYQVSVSGIRYQVSGYKGSRLVQILKFIVVMRAPVSDHQEYEGRTPRHLTPDT
jgi:hypothetical protein